MSSTYKKILTLALVLVGMSMTRESAQAGSFSVGVGFGPAMFLPAASYGYEPYPYYPVAYRPYAYAPHPYARPVYYADSRPMYRPRHPARRVCEVHHVRRWSHAHHRFIHRPVRECYWVRRGW